MGYIYMQLEADQKFEDVRNLLGKLRIGVAGQLR